MKRQFGFQFVGQKAQGGVDIAAALYSPTRPAVIIPAQHSSLHSARHFVVPHVSLGSIQQSLELESVCITIRYHISNLTHDCGEYEDAN